jgi:hypothetical protein
MKNALKPTKDTKTWRRRPIEGNTLRKGLDFPSWLGATVG